MLDFGGVLVDVIHREDGVAEVAAEVQRLLAASGADFAGVAQVEADIRAGWDAYRCWKKVQVRRPFPREIRHREFWEELVAGDWPSAAREVVGREASRLCRYLDTRTKDRPPRKGALALLRALADMEVAVGLVSNALAGAGTRTLMRRHGFEPYVRAQVYSDEVGMRKPNPGIFERAATLLEVGLADCWYVGDTVDRDVLGARRAGVGRVVLMPSSETRPVPACHREPDEVIRAPLELLDLLSRAGQ